MEHVVSKKKQELVQRILSYLVLSIGAIIILIPIAWMISTALKENGAIFLFPPQWIPKPIQWGNFYKAICAIPFWAFLKNTLLITFLGMIGQVCSAAIVGFGFARLDFPGKDFLFLIVLSTMMLPGIVTMIPVFMMFKTLGWLNTFKPLIVPSYFGGGALMV